MPAVSNLVTSETTALGNLIRSATFRVPVNQRPWAWQTPEVKRFLADLADTLEQFFEKDSNQVWKSVPASRTRQPHFLGALVFFKAQITDTELEIVDGQQRLTLATTLASACIEHLQSLALSAAHEPDRRKLVKRLRNWIEVSAPNTGLVTRVSLDGVYNPFYREYCLIARSTRDRNKVMKPIAPTGMPIFRQEHPNLYHLKRAADSCRAYLSERCSTASPEAQLSFLDALERTLDKHMQCLSVTVTDYAHGLAIFRSLNSTGRGLSDADNLKNELFRRSPRKDAQVLRQAYFETLLALPARDMTAFLRLRHVSRFGLIQKQDVYDKVVESELGGGADMKSVIASWKSDAELVERFNEPDPGFSVAVQRDLEAIRTLDVTAHWSILLAAAHRFLPGQASNFSKCVALAKDFAFRMLTVKGRDTKPLDEGFAEACELLRSGKHVAAVRKALQQRSTDSAFVVDFSRYKETRTRVQYYVLWELERVQGNNSGLVPAPYNTTVDIEHILPQRFDAANPQDWTDWREPTTGGPLPSHGDYVSRLGNLLILEKAINSKMNSGEFEAKCTGNYPPALKMLPDGVTPRPSFLDSALELPHLLAGQGYTEWDGPTIDTWQKVLADLALMAWPLS